MMLAAEPVFINTPSAAVYQRDSQRDPNAHLGNPVSLKLGYVNLGFPSLKGTYSQEIQVWPSVFGLIDYSALNNGTFSGSWAEFGFSFEAWRQGVFAVYPVFKGGAATLNGLSGNIISPGGTLGAKLRLDIWPGLYLSSDILNNLYYPVVIKLGETQYNIEPRGLEVNVGVGLNLSR
jgi:hypothetical protein